MEISRSYPSPLGLLTLVSDGTSLTGLRFSSEKPCRTSAEPDTFPLFRETALWLDAYFSGDQPAVSSLPLLPRGTRFQTEIWSMLCEIPYGTTVTYGELAKEAARRMQKAQMSAQAIGGAVGQNPIPVIIPCHRVVGANRNLTGYSGGIDKKIRLLRLEGISLSGFSLPGKRERIPE